MLDALLFSKTPSLLTAVYRQCLWRVNTTQKEIYLTFDDGPIPEVTPAVLQLLEQYKAKATFFCIGKNVAANPGILQDVVKAGHTVANHTYNHYNGWQYSTPDYLSNVEMGVKELEQHGVTTNLFRPPYGKLKPAQYKQLKDKYRVVMWDVLSFDFDLNIPKEKVLQNVINNTGAGSVVVFHDSIKAQEKVLYALPRVLEHFSEQGFKFAAL